MVPKIRLLPSALALAIAMGTSAGIAFAATRPMGASAAGTRVYVATEGCRGHVYKPSKKVILACADANLYVTGLSYSSYGVSEAKGKGVFHLNDCKPDCAGGRFHEHGGTIRLFDVVRCTDGRRYFARARYSFPASGGKGTADIKPFMRCRSV
jgi:hypothetical protein